MRRRLGLPPLLPPSSFCKIWKVVSRRALGSPGVGAAAASALFACEGGAGEPGGVVEDEAVLLEVPRAGEPLGEPPAAFPPRAESLTTPRPGERWREPWRELWPRAEPLGEPSLEDAVLSMEAIDVEKLVVFCTMACEYSTQGGAA